MIELKNDALKFSFPMVKESLQTLVPRHVQETLPRILAQDRGDALKACLAAQASYESRSRKEHESLQRWVHGLSSERIAEAFREQVKSTAGFDSQWSQPGVMEVEFQRTLRIPDDGKDYPLPPGLGLFPLRHVDDHAERAPSAWLKRGGVLMPMFQAEAMWLNFDASYPFAVKIASGKINAITGESWQSGLNRKPQDYVVLPEQPWLDGFAVEKGIIRQFVAMPLGAGYSVEEQVTGQAEFGGIQIQVFPMKAAVYFEKEVLPNLPNTLEEVLASILPPAKLSHRDILHSSCCSAPDSMGLGAGGRMKQEIYKDPHDPEVWDKDLTSRCFVHLCNALVWREITGTNPPQTPVTAKEYQQSGLPWFDYYRDDLAVLEGSKTLGEVKGIGEISKEKGDQAIPVSEPLQTGKPVPIGPQLRPNQVREWAVE